MEILHLTLKKKWFDMILSGEKKEEYREIKPYWLKRLSKNGFLKEFSFVKFKNGYSKNAPEITMEVLSISINWGVYEWGAENDNKYFVIRLGQKISQRNIK